MRSASLLVLLAMLAGCAELERGAAAPAPAEPQLGVRSDACYTFQRTLDTEPPQTVTGTACRQPDGLWRIVPPG